MKTALVLGAGGFIGSHLVRVLKKEGYYVRGVDLKYPEYSKTEADEFIIGDLRDKDLVSAVTNLNDYKFLAVSTTNLEDDIFDEVYQLAADMGGAGFVFTGNNDADIMHNSALINLNVLYCHRNYKKIFYSSSACIYPQTNQLDANNPICSEDSAYPADPDSEYGWEKLFSERLYLSYYRNYGVDVRIARFHNIFGPEGTWKGGREKSPAALCRKVLLALQEKKDHIEVWGFGRQTRSFLYIDECIEGVRKLMDSDFISPINIGSEEMITINGFAKMIIDIEDSGLKIKNIPGPLGVNGRNSDNRLIEETLAWKPTMQLKEGIIKTYNWISQEIDKGNLKEKVCTKTIIK